MFIFLPLCFQDDVTAHNLYLLFFISWNLVSIHKTLQAVWCRSCLDWNITPIKLQKSEKQTGPRQNWYRFLHVRYNRLLQVNLHVQMICISNQKFCFSHRIEDYALSWCNLELSVKIAHIDQPICSANRARDVPEPEEHFSSNQHPWEELLLMSWIHKPYTAPALYHPLILGSASHFFSCDERILNIHKQVI